VTLGRGRAATAGRGAAKRRPMLFALAALVALVQWLGVVHGVAHGGGHSTTSIGSPTESTISTLARALFASHDESTPACPLYDHTTHGDALFAAGVPAGSEAIAEGARWHETALAWVSRPHGFLARAPPTSS
jgi:hypothetical protein